MPLGLCKFAWGYIMTDDVVLHPFPHYGGMPASLEDRRQCGRWVPACGGAEKPFKTRTGKTLLYVWNTGTGEHAYLDCETDLIMSHVDSIAALALH